MEDQNKVQRPVTWSAVPTAPESLTAGALMALPPAWPQMPPKVAKALCDVMAGAKMLAKDERNPFASYKYAGIEAFLEMLRPLCASAGLEIFQDELGYEFRDGADKSGKVLTWLVQTWAFGLGHSSGEVYPHQFKRTSVVQASMGSQAFGAGQSYALKSFLRSIGLIATGDSEDADSEKPEHLPTTTKGKAKPPTKAEARDSGAYELLESGIRGCTTKAELEDWAKKNTAALEDIPSGWLRNIRNEYARHMASLTE